jgi:hypothetical protein
MVLGVVIVWIAGAGCLSRATRGALHSWAVRRAASWQLMFVLLATGLALLEEAVTTTFTNLGPHWGVTFAEAHITASDNYLDVVLLHSVVVLVPMFVAWSWLLTRYRFPPAAVLVLFGVTGFLAEALSLGASLVQLGFWLYVYGLMVYLPAHVAPPQRVARSPRLGAVLLAVTFPLAAAIPVALLVQLGHSRLFYSLP